jgi:hypothetical protein
MLEDYRMASQLVASQVVLSSIKLVEFGDLSAICNNSEVYIFFKSALNFIICTSGKYRCGKLTSFFI